MRGQSFQAWLSATADSSWDTSVSNIAISSPLAGVLSGEINNASSGLARLRKAGRTQTQENLATAFKVIGGTYGFPSGRWTSGAQDLWRGSFDQAVRVSGEIPIPPAKENLSQWATGQINEWWGYLQDSGMGKAATRWISDKAAASIGNGVTALNDVPWVNIVIGILRLGYQIGRFATDKAQLEDLAPFSNAIPAGYPLEASPRLYSASFDSEKGLEAVNTIRQRDTIYSMTDLVSPKSTAVGLYRVRGDDDRVGWLMASDTFPASYPECQGETLPYRSGFGFCPGTGVIVDGFQAFAALHTNSGAGGSGDPAWALGLNWSATGDMLPTAESVLATAWQLAMAGNAMQGTIDAPKASRRWQLFARNLAKQILAPQLWATYPLNTNSLGSVLWASHAQTQNACDFTATLEKLWNTAAAQMGWLSLRELIALHPELIQIDEPGFNSNNPQPRFIASWAAGAAEALGPYNSNFCEQGPAIAGFQGRIEICAPVKALEALQNRQLKNYQGAQGRAAVLLPYARPTDPIVSRFDASDTLSAQGRIDLLNDLLQRPEVCEVDPADIPLPDDGGFEDAVILRQSVVYAQKQLSCKEKGMAGGKYALAGGYAATAEPSLSPPGLGLASPGSGPSGSPGSAVAALAAAAGLFWMMRR